jgi:hypothetical protein
MRVLVCGGRDFADYPLLHETLGKLHAETPFERIIHGAAPGADTLADTWAREWGVPIESHPADWRTHGKAAGAIRNRLMLVDGKPELVVAFPGGRGTANMVKQARAAGVRVIEVQKG